MSPPDVAVPSEPQDSGPSDFNGLYSDGWIAWSCCWIAPHTSLLVRKRGPAQTLIGGFRLVTAPPFRDGQDVTIAFEGVRGARSRTWTIYPGGQQTLRMPVPPALRRATGLIPVRITCSVDYVPARDLPPDYSILALLHLRPPEVSHDERHLCAIMLYLYFK